MNKKILDNLYLCYIDAHLDLNCSINSSVLKKRFGISRSKASRLFSIYKKKKNGNIRYSVEVSMYEKSFTFKKQFLAGSSFHFTNQVDDLFSMLMTLTEESKEGGK
ncbi:hypothetical protein EIJ81_01025 (plasmid) [Aliivibrio salmonicida]|nr:hypothetical protein EIJ81_01025 [Aliivibrio salmonicida]